MNRSIPIIGWSTLIFSAIMILQQLAGLFDGSLQNQIYLLIKSYPQGHTALESMESLMEYNRFWTVYMILYFSTVLFGAVKFIGYHEIGRRILEFACWAGFANACAETILSYLLWKSLQSALSLAMRGSGIGIGNLGQLGLAIIILGFILWVIPSIGLIVYFRNKNLKQLMK